MGPLKLAFVGDSVFDLLVRESIVCKYNEPIGKLNERKVKLVCCEGQSVLIKKILEVLTPEEANIYKWGRNAHIKRTPKNSTVVDYHCATGLECLFGYLYMCGNMQRINQLFEKIQLF